jgi:hypothetical protein
MRQREALQPGYQRSVFINCPFDPKYKTIFNAIVFAVYDAGFYPRCAFELGDASENRLQGIVRIIVECQYGIHDISRTDRDHKNGLPRFNMPLELESFLAANTLEVGSTCARRAWSWTASHTGIRSSSPT